MFPIGPGNIWVRLLIEHLSGSFSGSTIPIQQEKRYFPSEMFCNNNLSVINAYTAIKYDFDSFYKGNYY